MYENVYMIQPKPTRAMAFYVLLVAFILCISSSLFFHSQALNHAPSLLNIGKQIVAQYIAASVLMLLLWRTQVTAYQNKQNSRTSLILLLIIGVISRLILLWIDPYTSNDASRYLFDGRIALAGFDPYQIAHNAPELEQLRAQWMPPPEHAKYVTLYPPLALGLFAIASSTGLDNALMVWSVMTTSASLLVLFVAYKVLENANKLQHLSLIALSPLLILEPGEGLHLDIFSALAVVIAIYYWQSKRLVLVALFIAIGGLLKMLPMVLLLPMFLLLKTWSDRLLLSSTAVGLWLFSYGLSFYLGYKPVGSIAIFFEKWRSGSPLFLWLEPYLEPQQMIAIVVAILLIGFLTVTLYLLLNQKGESKGYFAMQVAMALPLLISPVIFSWYLLPLLIFNALRPNVIVIAWSICLPLTYEVLGQFLYNQVWAPANWPIHIIGITLISAILIELLFKFKTNEGFL